MPKIDFRKWTFEQMKEMCENRQCRNCEVFKNEEECENYLGKMPPNYWQFDTKEEK